VLRVTLPLRQGFKSHPARRNLIFLIRNQFIGILAKRDKSLVYYLHLVVGSSARALVNLNPAPLALVLVKDNGLRQKATNQAFSNDT
jgi:hypothetical protein